MQSLQEENLVYRRVMTLFGVVACVIAMAPSASAATAGSREESCTASINYPHRSSGAPDGRILFKTREPA